MLLMETYFKIHKCIDLTSLSQKLDLSEEEVDVLLRASLGCTQRVLLPLNVLLGLVERVQHGFVDRHGQLGVAELAPDGREIWAFLKGLSS